MTQPIMQTLIREPYKQTADFPRGHSDAWTDRPTVALLRPSLGIVVFCPVSCCSGDGGVYLYALVSVSWLARMTASRDFWNVDRFQDLVTEYLVITRHDGPPFYNQKQQGLLFFYGIVRPLVWSAWFSFPDSVACLVLLMLPGHQIAKCHVIRYLLIQTLYPSLVT